MDKEAQEMIKTILEDASFRSGLSFLIDSSLKGIALDIVAKMEELGYRKPLDSTKVREKLRGLRHDCFRTCKHWQTDCFNFYFYQ